ncbi:dienelactone hydrolase [Sphingomonas sp. H39-1-10]|uniref:alpha/beta hydrolase family protein n=1 Tax=Sphingomonas TaxID=13687 RepID=UPI00088F5030|nr:MULTISPECIES: dienelactone hydrolase [Sphingomonas]MDF0486651.1 dienelactone hydrolase [Sphingomonas pollutisoli]SDA36820.1 Alpha/beta hydrolase family protein [Sphingomonas sp. NFR15]
MRKWTRALTAAAAAAALIGAAPPAEPPSRPGVDAPELARLGADPVGVADLELVQLAQPNVLKGQDRPIVEDRHLPLKVWYPATRSGPGTIYRTALSGETGVDVPFTIPGVATPDAPPRSGRFPLVILAHGYGNTPELLAWLGENLASKGYVVVAPAFRDPPISDRSAFAFAGPLSRRPLDIAFVAAEVQRRARAGQAPFAAADPDSTALIGYSMGGYGVLTAAGAPLDPWLGGTTRGVLAPYAAGGANADSLEVAHLKAVVAIAPAVRLQDKGLWAGAGVAAVTAPTLFIVGSQDHVVGYDPGVRTAFDQQVHAPRYLLTFKEAGHSIALSGAPAEMRRTFWDIDWLEDAVWRKDRLLAVQTHFITAFLDRYVKGDAAKASYLDGLVPDSDAGVWPGLPRGRFAGFSPGAPSATVWKGFQPSKATGMMFEHKPAS